MADKGWTSRAAVAAAAAAGTGAAQLGLGYGLSVVVWPVAATPDDSAWLGSLGWATWIAASATVFGAVIASRLGGPADRVRGPEDWVRGPGNRMRGPADEVRGPEDRERGAGDRERGAGDRERAPEDEVRGPENRMRGLEDEVRGPEDRGHRAADLARAPEDRVGGAGDLARAPGDRMGGAGDLVRTPEHRVDGPVGGVSGGSAGLVGGLWRALLAASAGLGSLVTVALIALPARDAVRVDTFSPQIIAGGYALFGVVLGVLLAYWAVSSRPVAANLIATGVWLWSLAIAAVVVEVATHRASATYLTSWQFAEAVDGVRFGGISWPSGLLTLAAAFLLGLVAAAPAARRGDLGVGAATCGVAGPLLVATAFLTLAPQVTTAVGPLASAYLIAPYAIVAGLAGSALTVTVFRATAERRTRIKSARTPAVPAGDPTTFPAAPAPKIKPPTGRAKPPLITTKAKEAPTTGPDREHQAPPAPRNPTRLDQPHATPRPTNPIAPAAPRPANPIAAATPRQAKPDAAGPPRPANPIAAATPRPVKPDAAAAPRPAKPDAKPQRPPSTVTPPPSDPTIAQINRPPAKS